MSPLRRFTEIDGLRGLMLILMTVTHLPTAFSGPLGQPFGFVSAAEGFVFLSAFLVGTVYTRVAEREGMARMRNALLGRSAKVYAAHVAVLLGVLVLVVRHGEATGNTEITNWFSFHASRPRLATASALVLVYDPPLFDILPMYVLFLALTPAILRHALERGWEGWIAAGAIAWLLAQTGLPRVSYAAMAAWTDFPVPYAATGAFSWMAWQFLWLLGLWAGWHMAGRRAPIAIPHAVFVVAAIIALAGFLWRHAVGQAPFGADEVRNAWFDKWHLGPARLLNFAALAIVAVHLRDRLAPMVRHLALTSLGHAALPVFCTHLALCAVALAYWKPVAPHPWWIDAAFLAGAFAVLYGVALATTRLAARPARGTPSALPAVSGRTPR